MMTMARNHRAGSFLKCKQVFLRSLAISVVVRKDQSGRADAADSRSLSGLGYVKCRNVGLNNLPPFVAHCTMYSLIEGPPLVWFFFACFSLEWCMNFNGSLGLE